MEKIMSKGNSSDASEAIIAESQKRLEETKSAVMGGVNPQPVTPPQYPYPPLQYQQSPYQYPQTAPQMQPPQPIPQPQMQVPEMPVLDVIEMMHGILEQHRVSGIYPDNIRNQVLMTIEKVRMYERLLSRR